MTMGITGYMHSVESFGTLDGPGVRYVLFLQGCGLRCLYCHNPDTWNPSCGKAVDSEQVAADIFSYRNFIRTGGVTISGGEPFLQPEFVVDLLQRCRKNGIHTAVDTAGSVPLSISKPIIDAADMLLLDIKSLDEELCKRLTGQGPENTLATLDYCEQTKKRVWLRHVLVPGLTLDKALLEEMADYLRSFSCIELTELLPFHKMGEFKWKELNLQYELGETPAPSKEELQMAKRIFEKNSVRYLLKE